VEIQAIIRAKLNNNRPTDTQLLYKPLQILQVETLWIPDCCLIMRIFILFDGRNVGKGTFNPQILPRWRKDFTLKRDGHVYLADKPFCKTPKSKKGYYLVMDIETASLAKNPITEG